MATPDTGGQGILGLSNLFGGLGILGGPVRVEDADTGTGVEGTELAAQVIINTDSGTGVEGTESIDISNAVDIDTGEVTEEQSLGITLEGDADHKESGVGVDTESYQVLITSLESGVVVDTEAISATLTETDSGEATEAQAITFERKLTITIDSIEQSLAITIAYEGG